MNRHRIILDTDPGVDDAMAIAFALCHPEIELLGLTTVFGNAAIDITTRNAQYLLEAMGATEVAVAQGETVPRVQTPLPPADFVHGADGLGNIYPDPPPVPTPRAAHAQRVSVDAAHWIAEQARAWPGEITLVAIGPLTNLARALDIEPALSKLIRSVVIMGGTLDEPGNVTPLAEANFFNDPHAADRVLSAAWPVAVVGLDITHRILISDRHLALLRDHGGATGDLLWRSSRFYVDFYTRRGAARFEGEPACAMHDAAALACVLLPAAFVSETGPARVIHDGLAAGQLALDRKGYPYATDHWAGRPPVTVCMQVDEARVRELFLDTVIRHHRV